MFNIMKRKPKQKGQSLFLRNNQNQLNTNLNDSKLNIQKVKNNVFFRGKGF